MPRSPCGLLQEDEEEKEQHLGIPRQRHWRRRRPRDEVREGARGQVQHREEDGQEDQAGD